MLTDGVSLDVDCHRQSTYQLTVSVCQLTHFVPGRVEACWRDVKW